MSFEVETTPPFEKDVKRLYRKHPSLKNDLLKLIEELQLNPKKETSLGNDFYKIRLAISSKSTGKSGGARVITLVKIVQSKVYLASIYDKNEQADISDKELKMLAKLIDRKV